MILALPYAYRALASGLDALDAVTLSEAARSLGASWFTVMFRVIAPNMRQAILNAVLLTGALVLGEFTIAYLLLFNTLQPSCTRSAGTRPTPGSSSRPPWPRCCSPSPCLMILSYAGRRRRRG